MMPGQEIIKVREWIPRIGPLTEVIRLKLFLDSLYPVLPRKLLARCVDVFVEDEFMFRFVSFLKQSKTNAKMAPVYIRIHLPWMHPDS